MSWLKDRNMLYMAAAASLEPGSFEGPVVLLIARTCGHCLESETVCVCEEEPPC